MNKKTKAKQPPTAKQRKRLHEAERDFQRLQQEILPYVKRRRIKPYSTAGQWRETSSLNQ